MINDPLLHVITDFSQYDNLSLDVSTQQKLGELYPYGSVFLPLFRKSTPLQESGERKVEQPIPPGIVPEPVRERIKTLELYQSTRYAIDITQYNAVSMGIGGEGSASGGFGIVVDAYDTVLNKPVKIKFLNLRKLHERHPNISLIEYINAFLQEMRVTRKLSQKIQGSTQLCKIPTVYEGGGMDITLSDGSTATLPFMVMEKIEGASLRTAQLTYEQLAQVTVDIAETLDIMHLMTPTSFGRYGVTHNDVKPSNIMVDAHGRGILVDFGGATGAFRTVRATGSYTTTSPTEFDIPLELQWGMGFSWEYAAPELLTDNKIPETYQVDQHALAMSVYERFVGTTNEAWSGEPKTHVVDGQEKKYWTHIGNGQRLNKKDLPDNVFKVLVQATSYYPRDRFVNCQAFAHALKLAMVQDGLLEGKSAIVIPVDFDDGTRTDA